MHRAGWQYPPGVRLIGEYWLQSGDVAVVVIFEADSIEPIFATFSEWSDEFDMSFIPAITGEDGLKWAAQKVGAQK